jgi:hypothetical protein
MLGEAGSAQLLWHRHRMVQMRTRVMNQLQVAALNEGLRPPQRSADVELKRCRVYALSPACAKNGVPTQTSFFFQNVERNFLQSISQRLLRRVFVAAVPHKRWHECTDVVSLLPAPLGFLPDQMEA